MNDFDEKFTKDAENNSEDLKSRETEHSAETSDEGLQTQTEKERVSNADESNTSHSYNSSDSQRVVFNDDGTYRGVSGKRPEENNASSADRPYERQSYPYNNSSQGSYPYGSYNNGQYRSPDMRNNQGRGATPPPPPYGSNGNQYAYNMNSNPYEYYYGEKKKKNGVKIFAVVAGVLFAVLILVLVALAVLGGNGNGNLSDETTTDNAVGESQNADEFVTHASPETDDYSSEDESLLPKGIYKKVLPSSVGILVYNNTDSLASEGSGVFFQESNDGKYTFIITCAHVINDASGYIVVQSFDGKEYDATVVGYDTRTDIGVLRIEATGFTLAEIGDSTKVYVGDPVYAIGNPGGVEFANSFTNGMVSALDRPVNSSATGYTTDCIQHTAAINPGNSGGALVNSFGQVIGINSMKIVADEYEGMGFAVPSSVFQEVVNEIMAHGYVTNRPKLGITYVPASQYSNYGMFVAIKGLPAGSIVIYSIASDSSLAGTEIQEGDMIVGVNGNDLSDPSELAELVENSNVGDSITLSIVRINKDYSFDEFDVKVTLVEDRGDMTVEESASEDYGSSGGFEDYFKEYFGE